MSELWKSGCGAAHGENWTQWIGHLKSLPVTGLELGTWQGESAEWMLENVFTHREARYCCVDTFEGSEEHKLAGMDCSTLETDTRERLRRFGHRAQIFKGLSHAAMKTMFSRDQFDFIYVDAAHDAMNVMRDSVLAFDLLKPGGVILWDDYGWHVFTDPVDCPQMAIDAFIGCYAKQLEVIGMGWQVAAKKL